MNSNICKPNFFIVGAPRCGTTAMYTFLKQHSDIYMPSMKEPHFFGQDLILEPPLKRVANLDQYLALFQDGEGKKRVGEASTQYLNSKTAAQEIKDFSPDALIIIMLRNPVDSLYSIYFHRRYRGTERAPTFEAALELQMARGLATYTDGVCRYFDVFGRERVHLIIHDDLRADVAGVYRATLEFMGVNPDFQPVFQIVNPNKVPRSTVLRDFLWSPPQLIMAVGNAVLPVARPIYRLLRHLNARSIARQPMNPEMRRKLQVYFRPEVERLSELLGRDLTHWCE